MVSLALRSLADAVEPLADRRYLRVAAAITALILLAIPFEVGMKPFARQFRIDNPYINYPLVPDHVPVPLLAFLSVLLPFSCVSFMGLADARVRKHAAISVLGLLLAIAVTVFVIDVFKVLIGNQRPDFIARCQPRSNAPRDTYVSVLDVCTNTDMAVVWEGCKSTPSGHSALSFAGLGFLAIWLVFTYDLLREDRPFYLKLGGFAPFALAAYVAFTRIIDHKHHWLDIISGGVLGTAVAYASYGYVVAGSRPDRTPLQSTV